MNAIPQPAPSVWEGFPLPGAAHELSTPSWRFWVWGDGAPAEAHMVYITAVAENLAQVGTLALQLAGAGIPHLCAVRLALNEAVVDRLNSLPDWSGRAATFYLSRPEGLDALASRADALLADRGLQGPPALRARPYGGRSGMVFLGASTASRSSGDARRGRLAALLGLPNA